MGTDPNPGRADYFCLGQSVQLWSDASPKNAIPDMLLLERMTIFESRRPYRELADANADGLIATHLCRTSSRRCFSKAAIRWA